MVDVGGQRLVFSRYKYLIYSADTVLLFMMFHAIGGFLLGPWLSNILPFVPNKTISMLSSSTFSPLATIIYAAIRFNNIKPNIYNRHTIKYATIGITLSATISLASIYVVGNHVMAINEIWSLSSGFFIASVLLLTIVGPIMEETLFRGYLYELLVIKLSKISSLIIVSLIFYLIHAVLGGFSLGTIFTLAFSVAFTFAYINGGLFASILSHVAANTLLFIACSFW